MFEIYINNGRLYKTVKDEYDIEKFYKDIGNNFNGLQISKDNFPLTLYDDKLDISLKVELKDLQGMFNDFNDDSNWEKGNIARNYTDEEKEYSDCKFILYCGDGKKFSARKESSLDNTFQLMTGASNNGNPWEKSKFPVYVYDNVGNEYLKIEYQEVTTELKNLSRDYTPRMDECIKNYQNILDLYNDESNWQNGKPPVNKTESRRRHNNMRKTTNEGILKKKTPAKESKSAKEFSNEEKKKIYSQVKKTLNNLIGEYPSSDISDETVKTFANKYMKEYSDKSINEFFKNQVSSLVYYATIDFDDSHGIDEDKWEKDIKKEVEAKLNKLGENYNSKRRSNNMRIEMNEGLFTSKQSREGKKLVQDYMYDHNNIDEYIIQHYFDGDEKAFDKYCDHYNGYNGLNQRAMDDMRKNRNKGESLFKKKCKDKECEKDVDPVEEYFDGDEKKYKEFIQWLKDTNRLPDDD